MNGTEHATRLRHVCEVCGRDEILTPDEAYSAGWDYPPKMGHFGIISPRTCGKCSITGTAWWSLEADDFTADMLTDAQRATITRILAEPASIQVGEEDR